MPNIYRSSLIICLLLAFFLVPRGFAAAVNAPVNATVEQRLEHLESIAQESQNSFTGERGVHSYLNTNLNLGGFSETAITGIHQRAHEPQAAVSSAFLGLNIGAKFSDEFHFSSQILSGITIPVANPHDDPRGSPPRRSFRSYSLTTLITQAYLEWESSDTFRVQGGMGYAPYALTFQQLELVLFVRRGGPQLLRSNNELVHLLWQGIHILGQYSADTTRWGYNVYSFSPSTHTQMLGVGTRLWAEFFRGTLGLGLSSQTASRGGATYTTAGPDLRLRYGRLTFTSELAKSYGSGPQPWSFHLEPDFDVYKQAILLYVFGDYLESKFHQTAAGIPDPFRKWEYGAGVNWLPTSFTRLRLGGTFHDYVGSYAAGADTRNYWQWDISAGVAF